MAVLAPPVQVVASGAPPFVQVPSGAPPFVAVAGNAPPITIVASGAPPITLFNADGSIWSAHTAAGGEVLLTGEANGFATDFLHPVDAERVALKSSGSTLSYAVDSFFTQSGTSPKMVYDSAGVLGWSPHNMALQSAMGRIGFEWAAQGATITGGQPDPSGGSGALQVAVTSNTGNNISQVVTTAVGIVYTGSMWLKGTAGQQIFLCADGNGTTQQLVTFTGSWQRVSHTITALFTGVYFACETYNRGGGAHLPNVTFQCWGANYNRGTTPTAYLPTTTAARVGLVLDYDPVTHAAKGLLCEPQATNLLTNSNDLSALSAQGGTVTVNNQTGPDGTLTADTFTEDTTNINHGCYGSLGLTAGADYTFSYFIKMGTRRYATLALADGTNGAYAVYDLQSGVVGSAAAFGTGTTPTARMQALPNGWYRCILTAKGIAVTYYTTGSASAATVTVDGYGRQVFLGTGSTLFYGHRQLELGTIATSYVPTLAATVTRAGDVIFATSFGGSATAGSAVVSYVPRGFNAANGVVSVNDNTGNNRMDARENTSGNASSIASSGGVNTASFGAFPITLNARNKAAFAYALNDFAFVANSGTVVTDSSGAAPVSVTHIMVGGLDDPAYPLNGWVETVKYLPRRMSNAEMVTGTA